MLETCVREVVPSGGDGSVLRDEEEGGHSVTGNRGFGPVRLYRPRAATTAGSDTRATGKGRKIKR